MKVVVGTNEEISRLIAEEFVKQVKQIAEEDIPVFKIVFNDKKSLYKKFSYEENTEYSLGKEINIQPISKKRKWDGILRYVGDTVDLDTESA